MIIDTASSLALLENATLLLALIYLYSLVPRFHNKDSLVGRLLLGILIGISGIVIMLKPYAYQQGLIFDTRSVLLLLSGLYFGFVPTAIALLFMLSYRYSLGGVGMPIGCLMIVISASSGMFWRFLLKRNLINKTSLSKKLGEISSRSVFVVTFILHGIMLLLMISLPNNVGINAIPKLLFSALVIIPLLSMFVAKLLSQMIRREIDIQYRLKDDAFFRNQFNLGNIGIAMSSSNRYWLKVNPFLAKMLKYDVEALEGICWDEVTHPDDLKKDIHLFNRLVEGVFSHYELDKRFIASDNSVVYTHMTVSCQQTDKGEPVIIAGFLDITKQTNTAQALQDNKEQLSLVLEASDLGMWDWDLVNNVVTSNERSAQLLGCSLQELDKHPKLWINAIEYNGKKALVKSIRQVKSGKSMKHRLEYQITTRDGQKRWILDTGKVVDVDEHGKPIRMCGTHHDITDIKITQKSLDIAKAVYQNSSEAMVVFSHSGQIIDINPAFCEITGFDANEVLGSSLMQYESLNSSVEFYKSLRKSVTLNGHWQGELWIKHKTGEDIIIFATINSVKQLQESATFFVALFIDITQKKETEDLIWRQANFDPLTNLPNRRQFIAFLEKEIIKFERSQQKFALMFLDLDYFKEINDTLGHDMGDCLLIEATKRIKQCVRNVDLVARLGGDEFTIVLTHLDDPAVVASIANKILKSIEEPFHLGEQVGYISVSIGITVFPDGADSINTLLKNADQAMYAAKAHGRNRYHYFTPSMQEHAIKRLKLIQDLKIAIAEQQFEVYYQAVSHLTNDEVLKAEALIRWHHPDLGFIPPAEFIPIAEETGMIIEIGNWVFNQVCEQIAKWQKEYEQVIQVSINKSPVQFRDDSTKIEDWLNTIARLGISPSSICVEITEGLLLDTETNVEAKLFGYRDAGIQVSLDDFGTGYSSLSYLKRFDIDYLKIDKSFVDNLETDSNDLSLCEAIIVMAHKLGIKVIAEGIETDIQRGLLEFSGCDYGQGYLFSKPIPAAEFEKRYLNVEAPKTTSLLINKFG